APSGRCITRDAHGDLNGEMIHATKALVTWPAAPKLPIEALQAQHRKLNEAGLTSIRYPGASVEQYRLLQEMARRGVLTIRVNQLMRFNADSAGSMRRAIAASGAKP